MSEIKVNDVVQFNSNHKYKECLGIVKNMETVKRIKYYEVVIPIPECGGERVIATKDEITKVGKIKESHMAAVGK